MGQTIPRNLEALIKKAAVDPEFKASLIARRSKLVEELSLPLEPMEKAMLDGIPEGQLLQMIAGTTVPEKEREILQGSSFSVVGVTAIAAASVLALGAFLTTSGNNVSSVFGTIEGTLGATTPMVAPQQPPAMLKEQLAKRFLEEIDGKTLGQALAMFQKETGLRFALVEPPGWNVASQVLRTGGLGLTVDEALRFACDDVLNARALSCRFEYFPSEVRVTFSPRDGGEGASGGDAPAQATAPSETATPPMDGKPPVSGR